MWGQEEGEGMFRISRCRSCLRLWLRLRRGMDLDR